MLLTIFFDDQYWVAVVEWQAEDRLRAARHIFGTEPGMAEIFAFVLYELDGLIDQASTADHAARTLPPEELLAIRRRSPKRRMREAARALDQRGASTAAEEALRIELEQRKQQRRAETRAERLAEQERKYNIAREKAKQRHRGH